MRRLVLALLVLAALAVPGFAHAHPLGNFTTNRYGEVVVAGDRVYLVYVLDLAEIPTFQAGSDVERLGAEAYGARLGARLPRQIRLSVDGERRSLVTLGRALSFPPGAAGLRTTRLEVVYDAGAAPARRNVPISYADGNFGGRLGWREVVIRARDGASVGRTSVPAQSVSDRLTAYPKDMLSSPLDVGSASADVLTGATDGAPPTLAGARLTGAVHVSGASSTGFAALVAREQLSLGIVFLSLLVAMFWGAAHALTPGHGKAVVAAYLVGTRGRARDAFALGGVVTLTHTVGVFALGLVTIGLSEFVVPEDLYPWLTLVSSLLVVAVGVAVLRARVASARRRGCHSHHHHGHNDHEHVHAHVHAHGSGSKHHGAADHGHSHAPPPGTGWRGLVVAGVSGGLLPCPTALVVLLAAISLHRVAFGMLLILAFSTGLALVVTAIGLLAIGSRRVFDRVSLDGGLVRALPAFSAVVIVAVGVAMTVRSLPAVT